MAYRIETVTLTSKYRTTTAPAGLIFCKQDVFDFIRDRGRVHQERFMLLSSDLSAEFLPYHEEHSKNLFRSIGRFALSIFSGNGPAMLESGARLLKTGPGVNFSSDAFDRLIAACAWSKTEPIEFQCGRVGIFLPR